jgi:hypothetical protein
MRVVVIRMHIGTCGHVQVDERVEIPVEPLQ